MKGAHRDPVDHVRTTQPHAGESFIDTLSSVVWESRCSH